MRSSLALRCCGPGPVPVAAQLLAAASKKLITLLWRIPMRGQTDSCPSLSWMALGCCALDAPHEPPRQVTAAIKNTAASAPPRQSQVAVLLPSHMAAPLPPPRPLRQHVCTSQAWLQDRRASASSVARVANAANAWDTDQAHACRGHRQTPSSSHHAALQPESRQVPDMATPDSIPVACGTCNSWPTCIICIVARIYAGDLCSVDHVPDLHRVAALLQLEARVVHLHHPRWQPLKSYNTMHTQLRNT
jgi:hypothetical protein